MVAARRRWPTCPLAQPQPRIRAISAVWRSADSVGESAAKMAGRGDEHLRAFCTGKPIQERNDLLGVAVAPVDRTWYDTIDDAGFNPGGLFAVAAPQGLL